MNQEPCPNCGCAIIVQGKLKNAGIFARDKKLNRGTALILDVCKDCGFVIRTWVENPERLS